MNKQGFENWLRANITTLLNKTERIPPPSRWAGWGLAKVAC